MKDNQNESHRFLPLNAQANIGQAKSIHFEPHLKEGKVFQVILISLRKYWYVTLSISSLMMAFIAYTTLTEPKIYQSEIQLVIELKESSGLAETLATSKGSILTDEKVNTIETITQTLKSRSIVKEALSILNVSTLNSDGVRVSDEQDTSVDIILNNLSIRSGKTSNVLFISYTDTNPKKIFRTLNALATTYINYSIKTKKARLAKSISFIETQLPESRQRLERSAEEVKQFRLKHKFIDPDSTSISLADYREQIYRKLDQAKVQINQTQNEYNELARQLAEAGISSNNSIGSSVLIQDGGYQDLLKKFNDLDLAYNQERLRFSEGNPFVISVKQKRDQLLSALKIRAKEVLKRNVSDDELTSKSIPVGNNLALSLLTRYSELETNLISQTASFQSLSKIYDEIETQLSQLPLLRKQYTELQRQYSIYSQELTAFLQKLQELKLADAEQVVPWILLDPPQLPRVPISPNIPMRLGLGALVSLLAGVLVAFGLKKLDNRIDNPETVKSISGMPILSLIPKIDNFDNEYVWGKRFLQPIKPNRNRNESYSYMSFIEAIRTLALGIGLTTDRDNTEIGKVVAITSSLPTEGKSTIAFNTSIALSELGYRVLLVDVDFHRSTISKLCRTSGLFDNNLFNNSCGLTDALLTNNKLEDLIVHSHELKLDVLLSGNQSVNSITLLNSPRFKRLIDQWKQEYDYVLFDTPPIIGISDTSLIASLVDGLVFIVSLNVAERKLIGRALDIISSIKVPVLGLAVNQVDNQNSNYSKYYQYYQKSDNLSETPTKPHVLEG